MASILTNASALSALQTLSATNDSLAVTQNRISSGLKVSQASDNAAYWSIATNMRSDNKANSTVQDALGVGASKLDAAYTGMDEIIKTVDKIKEKLVLAQGASSTDQAKIKTEISDLQKHIIATAKSSTFAGSNLLSNSGSDLTIVAAYNRTGTTVTVDTVSLAIADTQVIGTGGSALAITATDPDDTATLVDLVGAGTAADLKTSLELIETALSELTTAASAIGSAKARVDLQKSFVSALSDSVEKGVGALVDADMNKESARLSALQVQQQLGVQALSIANSSNQNILSLFRQ